MLYVRRSAMLHACLNTMVYMYMCYHTYYR